MTARVLVVDDIEANLKLLQARLMAEYFEVITATNGYEALDICRKGLCDVVLLDVVMPGMDGYEVCRQLKADPATVHIPVVMVSSLDQTADKVAGLEAGADDFLNKTVNDLSLTTRVRSLARLKMVTDELRMRVTTGNDLGLDQIGQMDHIDPLEGRKGNILIVDDRESSYARMDQILSSEHKVVVVPNPNEALYRAADANFDLVIVSLDIEEIDPLRLCSQMRSLDRTRTTPILMVAGEGNETRLITAIGIGVNDYISRPVDKNELLARVRTQVRRKRLNDKLRDSVQNTMEMAVRDSLTGLNNRRYFDSHMQSMFDRAQISGKPLALIVLDIDFFKQVNDTHGHQAGDEVLRRFSRRLAKNVRSKDLASRYGGEEFVVAMPDTDQELAVIVAERMRREMEKHPITINDEGDQIAITLSAGISGIEGEADTVDAMIKRADAALYRAKETGRNRVLGQAA